MAKAKEQTESVEEVQIGVDPFAEQPAAKPAPVIPVHVGMNIQVFKTTDLQPIAGQVKAVKSPDGIKIDLVAYPAFGRVGEHIFDVVRRRPPRIMYGWDFVPTDTSLGVQEFLKADKAALAAEEKAAKEEAERRAKQK